MGRALPGHNNNNNNNGPGTAGLGFDSESCTPAPGTQLCRPATSCHSLSYSSAACTQLRSPPYSNTACHTALRRSLPHSTAACTHLRGLPPCTRPAYGSTACLPHSSVTQPATCNTACTRLCGLPHTSAACTRPPGLPHSTTGYQHRVGALMPRSYAGICFRWPSRRSRARAG